MMVFALHVGNERFTVVVPAGLNGGIVRRRARARVWCVLRRDEVPAKER
jgi:hypothetical protein